MAGRALLLVLTLPVTTLVLGFAVIVLCPFDRSGRLFPVLARLWCRWLCAVAGVQVQVQGAERLRHHQATVFVANHVSLFDPPALLLALPANVRVLAKRSLFYIPVFGQALWAAGIVPIDRSRRQRAIASMDGAVKRIRRGLSILAFAEGTRSRDGRLQPLKKGAFIMALQAGVPVQPVAVSGSREVMPPGALLPRPGTVHIAFLEPVPTTGLQMEHRDRLLAEVATRMRAALEPGPAAAPPVPA